MGWIRFCEQNPAECAVDPDEPATIDLTAKHWQTLNRINQQVNGAIKAKTDKDHWGVEDIWDLAEDGAGDCEDYQLLKRRLLVEAGFPRRALRMTVVLDEGGDGHAVMMVRTDRGDFILDNKRHAILPWHRTGYPYIKREGDRTRPGPPSAAPRRRPSRRTNRLEAVYRHAGRQAWFTHLEIGTMSVNRASRPRGLLP